MDEKKIEEPTQAHSQEFDQQEKYLDITKGSTVLCDGIPVHPQPTSDPLDPLNCPACGSIRSFSSSVCCIFSSHTLQQQLPSFVVLQEQYAITYAQVNWTVALPALGLAVGPLIWSSLADIYGRRIIFMVGTLMALGATIGAAQAPTYSGYMAARFFQGLGVSPASTVGLAVINDMFFEHERGQKIGLWVLAIDSGLLVGPIFGGFLNVISAAWIQWFTAILLGVLLILETALMPETLYPRTRMLANAPLASSAEAGNLDMEKIGRRRSNASISQLPRTKALPFLNLKPVPGMTHPKPWDSVVRFVLTFKFLVVTIAVLGYCFLWYWWVLSVITMLPAAYVDYSPLVQGLLFIGLFLGTLFAEIFVGGRLSDAIMVRFARKNNGVRLPEMRLWLAYPAGLITAVGLIVWGISIDQGYHWVVGQIALFLFGAGIQIGNTVVCSYIVDAFPLQSMAVIAFYAVFLNLSAFIDPFFIAPWQASAGWTWCFAGQGIIVFFGALPVIAGLQKFGSTLRRRNGQPSWVNPEFDVFVN